MNKPPEQTWGEYTRAARAYLANKLTVDASSVRPWPQSRLAEVMGCTANHIATIERDHRTPGKRFKLHLQLILAVAERGLDPRELLRQTGLD